MSLCKTIPAAVCFIAFFFATAFSLSAQENSPYSRYGLGNTVPQSNVVNRGMGGLAAAYADPLSVNFANPASYSRFQAPVEPRSGKSIYGRVLFDVGINVENKTLREPNVTSKFSGTYASFSHVQLGIPLNKSWGMSFGLRQLHRISYKVGEIGPINDAGTGAILDTGFTDYTGRGGTFLPNIGTGIAIKNLSLGVTAGYLFGQREFTTNRNFTDTVEVKSGLYSTDASYGALFFSGGAQYRMRLNRDSTTFLTLGISGNLKRTLNASADRLRLALGNTYVDTVSWQRDLKGTVVYPASYTAGFLLERRVGSNGSFSIGADLARQQWSAFRFFGAADSVQDNWQLRFGTQLRPDVKAGSGYFSSVSYRAGFYIGPDYIHVGRELPVYGLSFGMGLPLANYNRLSEQFTVINIALEYEKRGNNENVLKENLFRFSVGLNFSDLWFRKRKYE